MNHLWFDDFNNLWRTPVRWPTAPRLFPVVYIEPERGYYARWYKGQSTHVFELTDPMSPDDVEQFRREPESFFQEAA